MGKLMNKTTENKFDNSAFKLSKTDQFMSDMDLKQQQQQQQSKNHSFKIEDILNTNSLAKLYNNNINNSSKKVNSASPSSSASSSYCSPISSLPSPYAHQPAPTHLEPSNELVLNQMHFNPFNNFYFNANTLNTTPNEPFRNLSSVLIDQFRQNQFDFLKSSILTNKTDNIIVNTTNTGINNPNNMQQLDPTTKISMIDELAKQIDNFSETSKQSNSEKKKQKKILNKNSSELEGGKEEPAPKKKEKYTCSGNCTDLACSSMLGSESSQLPMCLRGTSEEQLHLASLFNTLIHHKKCRRTRTVFSDMQLIGLEKRFENQKYLSTPDRIQLAEFLGLSQLQVKTWYQNRRMKWKKKVLKDGSQDPPTKPKGRPKKNSIPSFSEILKAAAANNNSTGSSAESIVSSSMMKNSSLDENTSATSLDDGVDLSDDDENEEMCYDYDESDSDSDDNTQTN